MKSLHTVRIGPIFPNIKCTRPAQAQDSQSSLEPSGTDKAQKSVRFFGNMGPVLTETL